MGDYATNLLFVHSSLASFGYNEKTGGKAPLQARYFVMYTNRMLVLSASCCVHVGILGI